MRTAAAPAEVHLRTDRVTGHRYHRVMVPRIEGGLQPWRVWVIRDGRTWLVSSGLPEFNADGIPTEAAARAFIARTKAQIGAA